MSSAVLAHGLLDQFSFQVTSRPQAVAVIAGTVQLTYAELEARANQVAHRLIAAGVQPGSRVGLHLDRSLDFIIAVLAVLRAGATYVPLATDWPPERVAFLAADAALVLIVTKTTEAPALAGISGPLLDLNRASADEPVSPPKGVDSAAQAAYVMFTSGSTGQPKGVVVPQRAILRLCSGEYLPWGPELRFLLLAPLSFDASTFELWGALLHGGTCVVHPEPKVTFAGLGQIVRDERITCLWLTAGLFNHLIDEDPSVLRPVRHVLTGGEALSVPHVRRALDALPGTRLLNGYGPTEATTFTCTYLIPRDSELGLSVPIGRPLPRTICRVLDAEHRVVSPGTPGELYIGGDAVALGYLNRPELTAEKFVADRWSEDSSARLYRSGDLVRERPDGNLEFLGRLDDQLKIRGFRIEPGELESVLTTLPGIRQAAVAGRVGPDGTRELAAYLVLTAEADLNRAELREALASRVPAYLQPEFVGVVGALPLNANGKVDRARLVNEPVRELPASRIPSAAPRNELEAELVALWSQELSQPKVGIHDRFGDLGGHSLRALRLVARIRERWGVSVTLAEFMTQPTVAGLAVAIDEARKRPTIPPVVSVARSQPLPLTGEQMGLWYLHQQSPDSAAYHVVFAWRLRGTLDRDRLAVAWQRVVERHEVLRTRLVLVDGVPQQEAVSRGTWPIAWSDLSNSVEAREPEAITVRLQTEARAPFRLEEAPLWRWHGFVLGVADQILLVTLHHVIIDEWSLRLLFADLAAEYSAASLEVPALPPLTLQFADYAVWQARQLAGPGAEDDRRYWREALSGVTPSVELPFDRPAVGVATGAGQRVVFSLPPSLRQACEGLGRMAGTTSFVAALSAFQALLSRWSGEEEMVVGTPLAQRAEPGLEGVAGYFLNTLPLRLRVDPLSPVAVAVATVRETVRQAFAHGSLPLDQIVQVAGSSRREGAAVPLFNVMFVQLEERWPELRLPGLTAESLRVDPATSKVDLTLFLTDDGSEGWLAELEYTGDRFSRATAEALAAHVEPFFTNFISDPQRLVRDVPLLTPTAAVALLERLSPPVPAVADLPLDQQFVAQVRQTPDRTALVVENRTYTYAQLAVRAARLAQALRQAGVQPDDRVALAVPRTELLLIAILGTLQAGAGYVPLDLEAPKERVAQLLADARPRVVVTTRELGNVLPADGPSWLCVDELGEEPVDAVPPVSQPEHLAYLIYTSGSTGRPKGVLLEHRQATSLFRAMEALLPVDPSWRWLATTHFTFDISVFELLWPLLHGQTVVLFAGDAVDQTIPRLLIQHAITHFQCTPARAQALLLDEEAPAALGQLDTLILTGEPLSPELAVGLGRCLKGRLLDLYGPTETTIWSTGGPLPLGSADVHIGRPLANTQVAVVDEALRPLPPGLPGELLIGGQGVARGYWDQPDRTAENFVVPPFAVSPADRWYRTGDRVRWRPDGSLHYLGRRDFQVKLRGYRIELGEIETALCQQPDVQQAVVMLRTDPGRDPELVAYLVAAGGEPPESGAVRRELARHLPAWLIPARWVWLDRLPLTSSGKVNRRALPAPMGEVLTNAPASVEEPTTKTEQRLAQVWARVLGRPAVGRHEDFFALGGHSLLALRLVAAIQAEFKCPLSLAQLLNHSTVAQLAPQLGVASGTTQSVPSAVMTLRGQGSGAPLFHIPGLYGYGLLAPSLAQVIGRCRRYFDGLQVPGLARGTTPCTRVEDLADDLIRQIDQLYPVGPLCLLGSSFGGLVASEMARRMAAAGRTVELLVLLDTILGKGGRKRSLPESFGVILQRFWKRPSGKRFEYLQLLLRNKFSVGLWYDAEEEDLSVASSPVSPEVAAVVAANERASATFQSKPYAGRVALLQATQVYDHIYLRHAPDPQNGWGTLLTGDFQIYRFDCLHLELFREPIFPEVFERLDQILGTSGPASK